MFVETRSPAVAGCDDKRPAGAASASRLAGLRAHAAAFRAPSIPASLWQVASSFAALFLVLAAMYALLQVSYWVVLPLGILAAGLVVRIFIIQHDCGHGSFLATRRGNQAIGRLCSLVTLTPFANWRRQHSMHHANWNNLDRREGGVDIYSSCLTVDEYKALPFWSRLGHRMMQQPLVALLLIPPLVFLVLYRVPFDTPASWVAERRSVWLTDAALVALYGGLSLVVGVKAMAMVQLPVMGFAAIFGVWLFSLQHRFRHSVWMRNAEWDASTASLAATSHLHLPRVLQWFTASIGFHHIHHLDTRVPNYRLEACHNAHPDLRAETRLSFLQSLVAWRYALWDEVQGRMVSFREARTAP